MNVFELVENAEVESAVFERHPDYGVVLIGIKGMTGGASDERVDALLLEAERFSAELLASIAIEDVPTFKAWRDAFLGFGVKPRVAKSSVEALVKRSANGLPRIDLLTDLYNYISVRHLVPIGGENADAYIGAARLVIADGTENFDTRENGETINQSPDPGEIVWRDEAGVTCRRWNWRQCVRTRLDENTHNVLFILDGLGEDGISRIQAAADELIHYTNLWWPSAGVESRLVVGG